MRRQGAWRKVDLSAILRCGAGVRRRSEGRTNWLRRGDGLTRPPTSSWCARTIDDLVFTFTPFNRDNCCNSSILFDNLYELYNFMCRLHRPSLHCVNWMQWTLFMFTGHVFVWRTIFYRMLSAEETRSIAHSIAPWAMYLNLEECSAFRLSKSLLLCRTSYLRGM